MASWEKNSSNFWPAWGDNKLFTVLLAILIVYSTVWVGAQIKKTMREAVHVGVSDVSAPTISVSATGKANAIPDVATTDIAVTKTSATAVEAQNAASVAMSAVLGAVKTLGIPDADLQTSSFNTSQVFDYDQSPPVATGYQSTQTLTVKVRNADLVSSVLDAGPKNGATSVSGIRYEVGDDAAVLAEARNQAIGKAETQARDIAKSLHAKLGRVVSYNESTGGNYPIYYGMADTAKAVGSVMPPVEVGTQESQLTVSITYAIN